MSLFDKFAPLAELRTALASRGRVPSVATPMDNASNQVVARTTLGVGTVAKVIPGVLQIDAYAAEGSSGSPVFGSDGALVGVVYGGAEGSGGRIVYAIPASAVKVLLEPR